MSGLKQPELTKFYASLQRRGRDAGLLADFIGVSRPALTRVLNGTRRRGNIWLKVVPLLTPEEVALLDVAHRSLWNNSALLKRPVWTPEKAARLRVPELAFLP